MTNIPVSERSHWIGASESAALFGLSPYVTKFELWHQKAGNVAAPDLSSDERINAGQFMEPSIAAWASQKWNWPILKVTDYRVSPRVPRMGCSLDFQTVDGLEPVEIKNVDASIFYSPESEWAHEGDELTDAPAYFLVQVQHQLACPQDRPADRGWLIVCVGGNRLYRMPIDRHQRLIDKLENEVAEFWRSVAENRPPEPNFDIDATPIGLLYTGSGGDCVDLRDDPRARDLAAMYREALERENEAKKIKSATLAELKVKMLDAKRALIDDGYAVQASLVKEGTFHRDAHWRFAVTRKETP